MKNWRAAAGRRDRQSAARKPRFYVPKPTAVKAAGKVVIDVKPFARSAFHFPGHKRTLRGRGALTCGRVKSGARSPRRKARAFAAGGYGKNVTRNRWHWGKAAESLRAAHPHLLAAIWRPMSHMARSAGANNHELSRVTGGNGQGATRGFRYQRIYFDGIRKVKLS